MQPDTHPTSMVAPSYSDVRKRKLFLVIIVLLVLLLGITVTSDAYLYVHRSVHVTLSQPKAAGNDAAQIDTSVFQALFLQSGQVYFGHLTFLPSGSYKLTDIYYVNSTSSTNLIKLGNEIHKPQDEMVIPATSVEFWENLQDANQFGGQLK